MKRGRNGWPGQEVRIYPPVERTLNRRETRIQEAVYEHSNFLEEKLHNSFFLSKKGNLGRTKPTYTKPRVEKSVN
jgi:hypothetical protein